MKIPTKAIIAAAGMGTRFLPQTKAMPKEMLPIVDKPVIQIIVEQLVEAGVTDIIIVTGATKRAIEDHFDRSEEFEAELRAKGKIEAADQIQRIAEMANFAYVRQKGLPKGNARPVLNAAHLLTDDEPFFVFFADDFFRSETPQPKQLLEAYKATGSSVISLVEVPQEDSGKYGMADIGDQVDDRVYEIKQLVEKPGPESTPSNFASTGGYLLTQEILPIIAQEKAGHGGEIVIADSINEYAKSGGKVHGCFIEGVWHDTGDKARYLEAIVDHALVDPKLGPKFRQYLDKRLKQS